MRKSIAAAAAVTVVLLLAGCTESDGSSGDPAHPGAEKVDPRAFGGVVE